MSVVWRKNYLYNDVAHLSSFVVLFLLISEQAGKKKSESCERISLILVSGFLVSYETSAVKFIR